MALPQRRVRAPHCAGAFPVDNSRRCTRLRTREIGYPRPVDVPPHSEQQAPPAPAVPVQRPGDRPTGAPGQPTARRRRPRNWRLIIAVMAGVLSPVCAAGSLAGYVWYDNATRPDLGTPIGAVRQYLNAYLGDRDTGRAAQFACGGNADIPNVKAARDDLVSREAQYDFSIHVSVDTIRVTSQTGQDAEVGAHINLTTEDQSGSRRVVEQWTFRTHDDGGWRVCDGHEVG